MEEQYKSDLKEIKDMMNRSSRFISLNGASGISVGVIALVGAYLAYANVFKQLGELNLKPIEITRPIFSNLLLIALMTLIIAIISAVFFTTRESKKLNQDIWDIQTKRLVINLSIPLVTGGLVCLFFLLKGYIALLTPLTLIFHGLALVNASQYTLKAIRGLGILIIILGILALFFLNYGIWFWAVGFGLLHILYGLMMQFRIKS
ncbi:MAG: hypothetical protein HKO96_08505 [Flavobacteriaceae bacterium]|nr:hypothetical protein [Flavobacteriaceae bacterium]